MMLIFCIWVGSIEAANLFSYFKQFNKLFIELWAENSLYLLDCFILSHKISPEWLGLLTSFLLRQFSIMIETN